MQFIRCILPNNEKQNGKFEDGLVLKQLITSSTISYAKFIRFGYAKHVALQKIIDECKCIENKFGKWSDNQLNFYSKVLLAIGLRLKDFKMGNDSVFFRSNKFHLLDKFFPDARIALNSKGDPWNREQTRKPK